ncbi:MAG: hypothetical protein U1F40_11720 [Turneriella sp.]
MKKITFPLFVGALALLSVGALYAQDAEAATTPAPDSKEAKRAARRAAAIAEVKQLLVDVTAETNKLNDALTAAEKGKEVVRALDAWANYLDGWKKKANSLEKKKGFKFLKSPEPPEELKGDLAAFMTSVNTMSQTLQEKVELFKDNPKFNKRIQQVLGKLKDL